MAEDTQNSTSDAAPDSTSDAAVRRADDLFDQAGQRLGAFAAQARMRLQALATQGAQAAQTAANRTAQTMNRATTGDGAQADQTDGSEQSASGAAPEPMERAEVLVDQAAQRLNALGQATNQRLQVLFAHLREEGEDIWAEAQNIRRPDTRIQ